VATTTMLRAMVQDVTDGAVAVHCLVPPGSCPGHFDATPSDLERLARCRLVLRHDFQAHLDAKLRHGPTGPVHIVAITSHGLLTVPDHYLDACRQVAEALARTMPDRAAAWRDRLHAVRRRVLATQQRVRAMATPRLQARAVVASHWQADFCRWLGLTVVATFDQHDQMSLADLHRVVTQARRTRAVALVGNVQRGTRQANVLAQRLGLPVVMLSNFPDPSRAPPAYDDLLRANVHRLVEVVGRE